MYTHELREYIDKRNGKLNKEDIRFVTDIQLHSQLNHISYNPYSNSYDKWTRDGEHIYFEVE